MALHITAFVAKDNSIKDKKEVLGKWIGGRMQQAMPPTVKQGQWLGSTGNGPDKNLWISKSQLGSK